MTSSDSCWERCFLYRDGSCHLRQTVISLWASHCKPSGSNPQICRLTHSAMGPSAQGLPSLRRLWGRTHSHAHSGCWQKAVPGSFRTEDPSTSWLSARGCLHSPSILPHLQAHSCFQSLPPGRESSLPLRAHMIPSQWSCQQYLSSHWQALGIRVWHLGAGLGVALQKLLTGPPYLYFLLRKLLNASALLPSKQQIEIWSLLPLSRSDFK